MGKLFTLSAMTIAMGSALMLSGCGIESANTTAHANNTNKVAVSDQLYSNSTQGTNTVEQPEAEEATYNIGAGLADITGEVAEANMFGYADGDQISTGVQQRLHARAFVIGDGTKEILMIVLDTSSIGQAMHQDLLKRLKTKYGNRFNKENVVLTATHTHASPGGYSHYALYGLTTRGFQEPTFDALQRGTMRAVDKAVANISPGTLKFGTSELTNANVQRSSTAFQKNPAEERAEYGAGEKDNQMQVLKFYKDGKDVASINWFAVHPTSLTNKNTLVSGDNKGYGAWYWEKQKGTDYLKGEGYVAAFANTNAGDMSPNLNLRPGSGPTEDQWQNAQIIGQRQADSAMNTETSLSVSGSIDYRQNYADFSRQTIDPKYTVDGKPHKTCLAAYKTSFAAGSTEDGGAGDGLVASGFVDEGRANPIVQALGFIISWPTQELKKCQETDQVAIVMGTLLPYPGSPDVLSTQIVRLGNLAILAVPNEFTVAAGHRLRKQVAAKLNIPFDNVVFAGYSNAYAGYVTTPEEYKQQDYEGASNHFGPHSLEAWQQNVDHLTEALINDQPVEPGPTPRDLSQNQVSLVTGVWFDNMPLGKKFGDVEAQPKDNYANGEQAKAVFWSAHPKSKLAYDREIDEKNLRSTEPYTMAVQYNDDGVWKTIATDYDWNTTNQWKRIIGGQSQATLTWDIPADAEPGQYRFYHRSAYKNGWTGKHIFFEGYSDAFTVGESVSAS